MNCKIWVRISPHRRNSAGCVRVITPFGLALVADGSTHWFANPGADSILTSISHATPTPEPAHLPSIRIHFQARPAGPGVNRGPGTGCDETTSRLVELHAKGGGSIRELATARRFV